MSAVFNFEKNRSDDPFYAAPEPRAFYHPSLPNKFSKKAQNIVLSPERVKPHFRGNVPHQDVTGKELSPGEKGFLSGSNTMLAKELPTHDTPSPGPADTSSKFDESWPASERPSTIESPGEMQNVSSSSAATRHSLGQASYGPVANIMEQKSRDESKPESESTLARLIDRFRFSAPQSREERARQLATGSKDFWWLSSSSSPPHPPSLSSNLPAETTPVKGAGSTGGGKGVGGARRGASGGKARGRGTSRIPSWSGISRSGVSSLNSGRRVSGVSTLASSSSSSLKMSSSATDKETYEIQRRAEKLLEISESTILSEPGVSSDGVGSFTTSSPITDDITPPREEAHSSRYHDKENIPRPSLFPANLSYTQRPRGPAEDILQQWRMRRRMELAKEGALQRVAGRAVQGPLRQAQAENLDVRTDEPGMKDTDSKLLDFRRRLQQQRLLTEARMASSVQPAPAKDAPTAHIGTDPIPQSIATQTGREVLPHHQTGKSSLLDDRAICGQQENLVRRDTTQQGVERSGVADDPVATQNMYGARDQRAHDVQTGSRTHFDDRTAYVEQEVPLRRDTTQQDGVEQSSLAEYPVANLNIHGTRNHRGHNIEIGSRPHPSDRTAYAQQEITLRRDTIQQEDSNYPIACPHIHGMRSQRGDDASHFGDVPPHLHLSCDILPCGESGPHVHRVADVKDRTEFAGHQERRHHPTEFESNDMDEQHGRGRADGRNLSGHGLHSQRLLYDKDQRTQMDNHIMPHISKTYYRPHRETVSHGEDQRIQDNQISPHISKTSHSDEYQRENLSHKNQRIQSKGQTSSRVLNKSDHVPHRKMSPYDEDQGTHSETETASHLPDTAHFGPHRETYFHGDDQRALTVNHTENQAKHTKEDLKTTQQRLLIRTKPQDDSQHSSITDSSLDVNGSSPIADQLPRFDEEGAKRQLDFGPLSPNPINNAIGQVISNRIFSSPIGQRSVPLSQRSSPCSVRSSAVSEDTLMFTPPRNDAGPPRQRKEKAHSPETVQASAMESESRASSDSEEFQDDEMLQVLRKQREQCIKQLNHLDNLLSHASKD